MHWNPVCSYQCVYC